MTVIVKSLGKFEVMVWKLVLISTQSRGQRSPPAAFVPLQPQQWHSAYHVWWPDLSLKSIVSSPTLYSFHQLLQNHFIIKLCRSSRRNRFQETTQFCSCLDEYFAFKKKQTLTQFAGNLRTLNAAQNNSTMSHLIVSSIKWARQNPHGSLVPKETIS